MGILNRLSAAWKSKTPTEKIEIVLDILTMIGGGIIGDSKGREWSQGHGRLGQMCIRVTSAGLGMAAGDIASKQLKENWAKPIGKAIENHNAKAAKKEE